MTANRAIQVQLIGRYWSGLSPGFWSKNGQKWTISRQKWQKMAVPFSISISIYSSLYLSTTYTLFFFTSSLSTLYYLYLYSSYIIFSAYIIFLSTLYILIILYSLLYLLMQLLLIFLLYYVIIKPTNKLGR